VWLSASRRKKCTSTLAGTELLRWQAGRYWPVRTQGDWEAWLRFYLVGVEEVATQATTTARALLALFDADRARVAQVGRGAASALSVYELLRRKVIISNPRAAEATGLSRPTVTAALERLTGLGITREITGKARDRQFVYGEQLAILDKGIAG
jgi:Fic family protein